MDLDEVPFKSALERDNRLNEQRVCIFEVEMHDSHHAHAHELGLEQLAQFGQVVCLDRRGYEFGLFAGSHGRGLDVLYYRHVILLVDLGLDIEVDAQNDGVGRDVQRAYGIEDGGIVKGHLFGNLHKGQDNDQIGYLRTDGHDEFMMRWSQSLAGGQILGLRVRDGWCGHK